LRVSLRSPTTPHHGYPTHTSPWFGNDFYETKKNKPNPKTTTEYLCKLRVSSRSPTSPNPVLNLSTGGCAFGLWNPIWICVAFSSSFAHFGWEMLGFVNSPATYVFLRRATNQTQKNHRASLLGWAV